MSKVIILADPRGFCAGVERAINIVEEALKKYGPPIYVRHEIVHNKYVVDNLKAKGVVFVKEINEIPAGAITVFSAHGVAQKVEKEAKQKDLEVIDATCPLVTKVHKEAQNHANKNRQIILIGHAGHPEVIGTAGQVQQEVLLVQSAQDVDDLVVTDPDNLAYVTQTTLSVDDTKIIIERLKSRFPNIQGPDLKDICYATQNRQNAVKELARQAELIIVVGSKNSSNSNRLRDLAEEMGTEAILIDNYHHLDIAKIQDKNVIGITAGASAPEILIEELISFITSYFPAKITTIEGVKENIKFKLPKQLLDTI